MRHFTLRDCKKLKEFINLVGLEKVNYFALGTQSGRFAHSVLRMPEFFTVNTLNRHIKSSFAHLFKKNIFHLNRIPVDPFF